jgi:uncharacterized protein (DUF983 family)
VGHGQDGNHLTSLVAQELDEEIRIPVGAGIAGAVAASGELIDISDAYQDDRFDASSDARLGFRTRDIYCMPVRKPGGPIIGVLQLLNRSGKLSADDRRFLSDISVHFGIAIENASRHLEILEKQRGEQQLALAREIILVKSTRKQRLLVRVLRQNCPVCLAGAVFSGLVGMRPRCDDCGYAYSRATMPIWGSSFFAWVATFGLFFGAMAAVTSVREIPTDPFVLSVIGVFGLIFMILFFRYWKAAWIALNLYSTPPTDDDFDRSKGFLQSVETSGGEQASQPRS